MAFSQSRGLLYTEPPEEERRTPTAESESATPAPADD